jgi:calcineurin-like phosphoesterase family protein
MTTFFTSDTHFAHSNIIKYCKRPYQTAQEMDEDLIAKWNSKVGKGDTVYHLGDFGFAAEPYLDSVIQRLHGTKHLILGNHDKTIRKSRQIQSLFASVKDFAELDLYRQKIVICHYPLMAWNKSHHGSWQLHGHCHGSLPVDLTQKRIDVGVDCFGYTPVSFEEIKVLMDPRKYVPVDHHGRDYRED